MLYRDFHITFDPPPIPTRDCDWQAAHVEYDGPEDNRIFRVPSLEAAKAEVDEWHDAQGA